MMQRHIPEEQNPQFHRSKNLLCYNVLCFCVNAPADITQHHLQFFYLSDRHTLNIETGKLRQQNTELRRLLHFYIQNPVSKKILKLNNKTDS
jgi:hypothetical protein